MIFLKKFQIFCYCLIFFHRYPIIFQKAGIPSAFKREKFDFWKSDFGRFSCPKQLRSKLPVSSRRMQCEARSGFASEKRGECTIVLDPSGERSKARDCPQCAAVGCFLWDSCDYFKIKSAICLICSTSRFSAAVKRSLSIMSSKIPIYTWRR